MKIETKINDRRPYHRGYHIRSKQLHTLKQGNLFDLTTEHVDMT